MLRASMLVIGDEILGGFVDDTNSGALARTMQAHGVPLDRIQSVPDEMGPIDEALQQELGRSRPRLIVSSGGIGSTPDDLTFEAIAASLGREVVEHPFIVDRVETAMGWQGSQGIEITDEFRWHMMRMARVPAGAELMTEDGWVPGLRVDVDGGCLSPDGATIIILPGVPGEFARILTQYVVPQLVEGRNPTPHVAEIEHGLPESALNLTFAALSEKYPTVKLGSYPGTPMLIRLSGSRDEVVEAETFMRDELAALLASDGGARLAAAWTARFSAMEERDRDEQD